LTWDDHEVLNDYADDNGPPDHLPQDFLKRRAAAYKAYFEHMPVSPRMAPAGPAMRIHDRYVWGRLAELWTLDNRQYRSVQVCSGMPGSGGRASAPCEALADESRSVFGMAQERWLAQGLAASTRQWKLMGQGTQLSASGVDSPLGKRIHTDGWDGYPKARERLLRGLAEARVANVLSLGGDVHRHVAAQLRLRPNDANAPIVASEFVCSSITSRGLSEALMGLVRSHNPDMEHARSDERGYARVEITPQGATCEFRGTPFPARPEANLHTQARCVVEAGRPGVVMD
jgi:alkaline phosphatase D